MNDADTLTLNRLQDGISFALNADYLLWHNAVCPPIGRFKTLENTASTIQKINSIIFQVKV